MAHEDDSMLRAGEPTVAAWRRVVEALLEGALHRLRPPHAKAAEDIHAVRVAIKHTRALLRMIRPALPEKIYRGQDDRLKAAAQQLSNLRDTAVGRDMLRELADNARSRTEKLAFSLVRAGYESVIAKTRTRGRAVAVREVVRSLEISLQELRVLHVEADEWGAIGPGVGTIYRSCRRRMNKALRTGENRAFHRWRMRLKNLLHVLQFITPIQPKKLGKLTKKLARLHQQIGADHDLIVLTATLRQRAEEMGGEDSVAVVLRRAEKQRRKLRRNIARQAAAIFHEKPSAFVKHLERRWSTWRPTSRPGP